MSIDELGALLGFVAFVGLAVLIFMTFQQARHLRRLRDWAGRAPERAAAVAERAGEETVLSDQEDLVGLEPEPGPSLRERLEDRYGERWAELDRRMPVDPRVLFGGLAAIVLGLGIAFGLGSSGEDSPTAAPAGNNQQSASGSGSGRETKPPRVAVLNGTSPPVPGIADRISKDVKAAGFRVGEVTNASPVPASVIMFKGSSRDDADAVADELAPVLGPLEVIEMTTEVRDAIGGSDVALIVGSDDATL